MAFAVRVGCRRANSSEAALRRLKCRPGGPVTRRDSLPTDRQHSAGRARPPDGLRPNSSERDSLRGAGPLTPAMAGILSACGAPVALREMRVSLVEACFISRPEIGRGYPLNLSISLSGGKETNQDSLSNGE